MNKFSCKIFVCAAFAASIASAQTRTVTSTSRTPTQTACNQMSLGQNASLGGFVPFPTTDPWRQNVTNASVDPGSAAMIAQLGTTKLHANFGAGMYAGSTIGMPFNVVSGQPNVNINYQAYGAESDAGPMPIPASTHVEGYPSTADGDRHVLVLDRDNCFLYELDNGFVQGDGSWNAASGAVWDLLADNARPYGWTSTDAAGLAIFPGIARYDEAAAGHIDHALRFTVQHSRAAFVAPATHWASSLTDPKYLPMGARLRLKASFDTSGFTPQAKIVLTALKTYGMIVADNGSNLYIGGSPDDRWNDDDLHGLGSVPASAFEVVNMGTVVTSANMPKGAAPIISSFTASAQTGGAVTLRWAGTGSSYFIVSPGIGAVRGNSVTVHPASTTTYTLYATNHFGQTTKSVTVTPAASVR